MNILRKFHMKVTETNYVEYEAPIVKLEKSNYVHIEMNKMCVFSSYQQHLVWNTLNAMDIWFP